MRGDILELSIASRFSACQRSEAFPLAAQGYSLEGVLAKAARRSANGSGRRTDCVIMCTIEIQVRRFDGFTWVQRRRKGGAFLRSAGGGRQPTADLRITNQMVSRGMAPIQQIDNRPSWLRGLALRTTQRCSGGKVRPCARPATSFLLAHRLFRSHRTGAVIKRDFLRLAFPPQWHFDILRALDYFRAAGAASDRPLPGIRSDSGRRRGDRGSPRTGGRRARAEVPGRFGSG